MEPAATSAKTAAAEATTDGGAPARETFDVHRPADGPVEAGGFEHLAIEVESLADATARLTEAGLEPGEPVLHGDDGPKTSWLTDPDGYRIELVEWPPGGPPTPDNP